MRTAGAVTEKTEDVVNIGGQQQVNVISMEDDEFSTDDERVSSLMFYVKCNLVIYETNMLTCWLLF